MTAYTGRFAPSPTGPLHIGSLIAALGSFLDARQQRGRWLLRIEDLDPPREVTGASAAIQQELLRHGLQWDGEVVFQSDRHQAYAAAIDVLRQRPGRRIYACDCSRARLRQRNATAVYPGYCRDRARVNPPAAWRLRVPEPGERIGFQDRVQGGFAQDLARDVGDFVVRRRDGLYAYQLAVVVDDAWQEISHIVRGADLLDNTPRQIWLQDCLGLPRPDYAHLPVALNTDGDKLSKQTHAAPISASPPVQNLVRAWRFLGQHPTRAEDWARPIDFLDWAITHWRLAQVPARPGLYLAAD